MRGPGGEREREKERERESVCKRERERERERALISLAEMPGSSPFPEAEEDAATTSGSREVERSTGRDPAEPRGPGVGESASGSGSGEDEEEEEEEGGVRRPGGDGDGGGGGGEDVDMSSTHGSSSGRSSSTEHSPRSTSTSSKRYPASPAPVRHSLAVAPGLTLRLHGCVPHLYYPAYISGSFSLNCSVGGMRMCFRTQPVSLTAFVF